MQASAVGNRAIGTNQRHVAMFVWQPQCQDFGLMLADLPGRKIDDGQNLGADQLRADIIGGQSGQRLLPAEIGAKIDLQDMCRITAFGEWLNIDDAADADIDLLKVFQGDRC